MKGHFIVSNMECAGCVARVEQVLRAFEGVVSIEVSLKERRVAVEYLPDSVHPAAMLQRLMDSGFNPSPTSTRQDPPGAAARVKRVAGRCLFHVCDQFPMSKVWFGNLGLRTKMEWFANRTANVQLPDGRSLRLASIGENYLSFQLFWRGTQFYEPITTLVLQELLRPGDTFLDVGANIGFYSLVLSLTRPDLRVVAFEPNPRIHALLKKNVSANQFRQITCEAAALSDCNGTATLHLSRSDHSASLQAGFDDNIVGTVEVPTLTLDSYLLDKHQGLSGRLFVKIDVEGNEDAVLTGARTTLATHKPDIVLETARNRQIPPPPFLTGLGYRLYSITDRGLNESSTWAPVVRERLVFLNHLLTTRSYHELADVYDRIRDQVTRIDLRKTSKWASPVVRRRAGESVG
jgi:FkbM family methyltransferase